MNWINSILPACCTGRKKLLKDPKKMSFLSLQNEIPDTDELDSIKKLGIKSLPSPVNSDNVCITNGLDERSKFLQIIRSDRENSFEIPSEPKIISIPCKICKEEAEGFCPSCPNMRYCKNCYKKCHKNSTSYHKFISYSKSKTRNPSADSIDKIKKIL
jgi:hypothetical protein